MIDPKTIHIITQQVRARFPETTSCLPQVRIQATPKTGISPAAGSIRYLVTYQSHVELPCGKRILRRIRVVVAANGKIVKITTSR